MDAVIKKISNYFGSWELGLYNEDKGAVMKLPGELGQVKMARAKNVTGEHVFLRPIQEHEERFVLLDDLDWSRVQADHWRAGAWKPGRLCVETSPRNFQVWVHFDRPVALEDKREMCRVFGSDPGADPRGRWGRCPGFRNVKLKYRNEGGEYPLSKLVWVDWRNQVDLSAWLNWPKRQAKVKTMTVQPQNQFSKNQIPSRGREIHRADYESGDESVTDFKYVLALLRRGEHEAVARRRLQEERADWTNHRGSIEKYLDRTIMRARGCIQ
jgi:hypothetical protein